jgi:hypothetical protein
MRLPCISDYHQLPPPTAPSGGFNPLRDVAFRVYRQTATLFPKTFKNFYFFLPPQDGFLFSSFFFSPPPFFLILK